MLRGETQCRRIFKTIDSRANTGNFKSVGPHREQFVIGSANVPSGKGGSPCGQWVGVRHVTLGSYSGPDHALGFFMNLMPLIITFTET
jgi:hypothetical protein